MKRLISLLTVIVASAAFLVDGCFAAIRTESFDFSDFTGINASGGYDIELVKSDIFSVIVEADDELMPYVEVRCIRGILTIEMRKLPLKLSISKKEEPKVTVTMPVVNSIVLSGSCDLRSNDTFSTSGMTRFSLNVSGASDVEDFGIVAPEIVVTASGASDVELQGETTDLDVKVSGASDFDGENLKAENVKVTASGASDVDIYVTKRLSASVSGASSCEYKANNQIQIEDMNVSGASSFKRKN